MSSDNRTCRDCYWAGAVEEVLHATHPFDKNVTMEFCPKCLEVDSILVCCYKCDESCVGCAPDKDGVVKEACENHITELLQEHAS